MFHPLAGQLSGLSQEELTKKYQELVQKLNQAYRFGPSGVIPQMQALLNDYQAEMSRRQDKQMEDMQKSSKQFKNIIDIQ